MQLKDSRRPINIAFDSRGNLYFADSAYNFEFFPSLVGLFALASLGAFKGWRMGRKNQKTSRQS